jgi:hypothetical protein
MSCSWQSNRECSFFIALATPADAAPPTSDALCVSIGPDGLRREDGRTIRL